MSGEVLDTDVLVVGYGPVGAMAALLLGRAGVDYVVADSRREIYPLPRAVTADEEALRMLCAAGLQHAVADMLLNCGAQFVDRSGRTMLRIPRYDLGRD